MYAFDEIQKRAHKSAKLVKYDFADKKLPPLASYTKSVFQRFDLHGTKPMLAPLTLPVEEREINVVVHDARQQVYSQLTNPTLMAGPNLNFTNDDPFALPPESPSVLGDINTGLRFREAYNVLCTIPGLHVLCPLIFFIDKTHTDTFGNLCLDPVTFTLGIFKRHLRNQPKAWRTLGYITNQSHHGTKGKAKAVDLQAILKVIIEDIEGLNKNGGVRWKFPYMGKDYDVVFKFTVLYLATRKVTTSWQPISFQGRMYNVPVGIAAYRLLDLQIHMTPRGCTPSKVLSRILWTERMFKDCRLTRSN
jgi:hypothetical protein